MGSILLELLAKVLSLKKLKIFISKIYSIPKLPGSNLSWATAGKNDGGRDLNQFISTFLPTEIYVIYTDKKLFSTLVMMNDKGLYEASRTVILVIQISQRKVNNFQK